MHLPPFELERFFAAHEFRAPHLLCASDCESIALRELLALEPDARERLENLWLGYTESTGGLDMAFPIGADPNVGPGRRDHQRTDAPEISDGAHRLAVGAKVTEALAGAPATNAGTLIIDIMQAGFFCADHRVYRRNRHRHRSSLSLHVDRLCKRCSSALRPDLCRFVTP